MLPTKRWMVTGINFGRLKTSRPLHVFQLRKRIIKTLGSLLRLMMWRWHTHSYTWSLYYNNRSGILLPNPLPQHGHMESPKPAPLPRKGLVHLSTSVLAEECNYRVCVLLVAILHIIRWSTKLILAWTLLMLCNRTRPFRGGGAGLRD